MSKMKNSKTKTKKKLFGCRRTGVVRPLSSMPGRTNKRKPPRGLVVNHDDLAALAGQPYQANNTLQAIETEIVSLKRQVRSIVWIHFFLFRSFSFLSTWFSFPRFFTTAKPPLSTDLLIQFFIQLQSCLLSFFFLV